MPLDLFCPLTYIGLKLRFPSNLWLGVFSTKLYFGSPKKRGSFNEWLDLEQFEHFKSKLFQFWLGKMIKSSTETFKETRETSAMFVCLCFSAHKPSSLSTFAYKEPSYSLRLTYVCGEELDQVSNKYNITILVDWESDGNLTFTQKNSQRKSRETRLIL